GDTACGAAAYPHNAVAANTMVVSSFFIVKILCHYSKKNTGPISSSARVFIRHPPNSDARLSETA
ncbi:MAG: hypothetical protein J1E04_06595, partial [Alistipes sp.]|nr:hypothetical protein [Alistipes sp.]